MSKLQSILFNKKKYTTISARKWLKNNDFQPIKRVHVTKNYLRYRLRHPYKNKQYRIIDISKKKKIKAVLMF